jgi:pyruvate dehydrogenase E2 component (dihydrolipoamide acetyltransferase)
MDVKLPKLGEGADSGVVVGVLVKEGDEVKEGQTLIELENEKAVAPIPATADGKVSRIHVKEGDKISVGQVILTLDTGRAEGRPTRAAPADEVSEPKKAQPAAPRAMDLVEAPEEEPPPKAEAEVAAAPSIRKLARELGIDLTRVRGTERGGRIVMADLRAYIQRLQKLASQPREPAAPAKIRAAAETVDFSRWGPIIRKPVSQLRKVISQRMAESWATVPRVTQFDEADITVLMELRKKYQAAYEAKGARLTLTPLALKAVVVALKRHPVFNASLDEAAGELVIKEYYHLRRRSARSRGARCG